MNKIDVCKRKLGSKGEDVSDDAVAHIFPFGSLTVSFKLSLGLKIIFCITLSPSKLTKDDDDGFEISFMAHLNRTLVALGLFDVI